MRYPLSALADACSLSEHALCVRLGLSGSTMQEARSRGLTELTADRYAVRMGLATYTVWPEMIEANRQAASVPCLECGEPFVPLRRSHRTCTKKCYQRAYKRERARRLYATDPAFREAQIAKSKAYRDANQRAMKVKKHAYYLANKERHYARNRERRARLRAAA